MKISIGRLKEIIMEEVANAAAVEESQPARATPEALPPEGAPPEGPPPPKPGLLKFLADLFGPIDPDDAETITSLASDIQAREFEKYGFAPPSETGAFEESLNIEIVDDE
jgi:hypothetical protein